MPEVHAATTLQSRRGESERLGHGIWQPFGERRLRGFPPASRRYVEMAQRCDGSSSSARTFATLERKDANEHRATLLTPPALLLTTSLCLAGPDVTLDQWPAPVRTTVERETKGGQITDIERDEEHGQTIYEVEFVLDGKEYELDIAADGQLLERRLD